MGTDRQEGEGRPAAAAILFRELMLVVIALPGIALGASTCLPVCISVSRAGFSIAQAWEPPQQEWDSQRCMQVNPINTRGSRAPWLSVGPFPVSTFWPESPRASRRAHKAAP